MQETKGRDILPILAAGKRLVKESTERVLDKRQSLADMNHVEYALAVKRDFVRAVCDPNEGTCVSTTFLARARVCLPPAPRPRTEMVLHLVHH